VVRSVDLVRADHTRLDLHWHVLPDACDPGDDDVFWAQATPFEFKGVPTKSLARTDMLLHVLVHGAKWTGTRSLLWTMDAYRLIGDDPAAIDWRRLVTQAQRHATVLPVLHGLECLSDDLGVEVPEPALRELRGSATSVLDRLDYSVQGTGDNIAASNGREVIAYLRRSRRRPIVTRLRGFWWFVLAAFGARGARDLPTLVARRVRARLS
jgi:hypothetical protein